MLSLVVVVVSATKRLFLFYFSYTSLTAQDKSKLNHKEKSLSNWFEAWGWMLTVNRIVIIRWWNLWVEVAFVSCALFVLFEEWSAESGSFGDHWNRWNANFREHGITIEPEYVNWIAECLRDIGEASAVRIDGTLNKACQWQLAKFDVKKKTWESGGSKPFVFVLIVWIMR